MGEEEREEIKVEPEENVTDEVDLAAECQDTDLETVPVEEPAGIEETLEEDTMSVLERQLAEAEQKIAEYLDGWQRCQASFTNFRKRTEAEQQSLRKAANAALLSRLLPVIDDFQRAFQALPSEFEGHSWLEGLSLIQRKVFSILEMEDVKPIVLNPGDPFDPMFHQAILYQEVEGFTEGQIVAEVERGYILGDRVLRPSMVVVAKVSPPPTEPESVVDVDEAQGDTLEAQSDTLEAQEDTLEAQDTTLEVEISESSASQDDADAEGEA